MTRIVALLMAVALCPATAAAQFAQRGFVEGSVIFFPQSAPNDTTRAVADLLVRDDLFVKPATWVQFAAGVDLRANTHDQVAHEWALDIGDRTVRRPAASIRRLAATFSRGPLTVDVGKQFIRWGKTDIVTPTDRFAPRDFTNVISADFLAVSGARAVVQVGDDTVEGVWVPYFTPSRLPLFTQRWTALPVAVDGNAPEITDLGAVFPEGSQSGVRWNHIGGGFEVSASFFDGFNHLPNVVATPTATNPLLISLTRVYPAIRMYGADAVVPTRWFNVKGEAAYFTSSTAATDEYVLYVVQVERQTGEWVFVGGYAGEAVTSRRSPFTFAPDRGLTRSLVGRAAYTIGPTRGVAIETAIRQDGAGAYVRAEYTQARGNHWRATIAGVAIAGDATDFLGQYQRNSHAVASLRYSF